MFDPYSMASDSSKSSKSSDSKSRPPRLPPRNMMGKKAPIDLPKPDYESTDAENEYDLGDSKKIDSKNKIGNS